MLATLRQRNFALLWSAGLVSILGDWMLFVALPFFIYQQTGSALATGGMFIAQTVPRVFVGSIAGVFVDRWNRQRTMVAADLSRAVLLLLLLTVHSAGRIGIVFVVAFVQAGIAQFFIPAKSALIPRLVGTDQLLAANALDAMSNNLTRLVGPTAGGALLGLLGLPSVVLLDSASFLISGLMIARIVVPAIARPTPSAARPGLRVTGGEILREWRSGLGLMRRMHVVTVAFLAVGMAFIGQGIVDVLTVPFVDKVLHGGPLALGWLLTGYATGGVTGSILLTRIGVRVAPRALIPLCGFADGLLQLALFNATTIPVAFLFVALHGAAAVSLFITLQTLLQRRVPDQFRGRVFGAYGATQGIAQLIGQAFASAAAAALGIVALLDIASTLFLVVGIVTFAMLRRDEAVSSTVLDPISHHDEAADQRMPAP